MSNRKPSMDSLLIGHLLIVFRKI